MVDSALDVRRGEEKSRLEVDRTQTAGSRVVRNLDFVLRTTGSHRKFSIGKRHEEI